MSKGPQHHLNRASGQRPSGERTRVCLQALLRSCTRVSTTTESSRSLVGVEEPERSFWQHLEDNDDESVTLAPKYSSNNSGCAGGGLSPHGNDCLRTIGRVETIFRRRSISQTGALWARSKSSETI
eukprot:2651949-Rhodomonas_salina.1